MDIEGCFDFVLVLLGWYDFYVEVDGFVLGKVNGFELEFDEQEIGMFVFEFGVFFLGCVVDEEGEFVFCVMFYLCEVDFGRSGLNVLKLMNFVDDGIFVINCFVVGQYVLGVQVWGFVCIDLQQIMLFLEVFVEFQFECGLMFCGIVCGVDGEGIISFVSFFVVECIEGYLCIVQCGWVNGEVDGSFEVGLVICGSYVLMVNVVEYIQKLVEVEISDSGILLFDIILECGVVLIGVVMLDGQFVSGVGVGVSFILVDDMSIEWFFGVGVFVQIDGEGCYWFVGVLIGEVMVIVLVVGYQFCVENFDIVGDWCLDFEFFCGLCFIGCVVDEFGDLVEGVYVYVMVSIDCLSWSGGQYQSFSDVGGFFEIGGFEFGWVQFDVLKDGYVIFMVFEIELFKGVFQEFEIVLG